MGFRACVGSRRRRSWTAEGSHERFGTVALDARDGRGNIRDAALEILFEFLRLCVAHLDLPHIAALATAQADPPAHHRKSPAQLHRRLALLVPGNGNHEVGAAATAADQSVGRRGEAITRTSETPEELDESHDYADIRGAEVRARDRRPPPPDARSSDSSRRAGGGR